MKIPEEADLKVKANRNRSNSSLVSRANRSRSNSFRPKYDEMGKPIEDTVLSGDLKDLKAINRNGSLGDNLGDNLQVTSPNSISIHNQEIRPVHSAKSHEDSGFFNSILNIAHNTANMISHNDHNNQRYTKGGDSKGDDDIETVEKNADDAKSTFSNKLDSLIMSQTGSNPTIVFLQDSSGHQVPVDYNGNPLSVKVETPLSPNAIHFTSVRESPVNTIGQGDLSLDDFKESRRDSIGKLTRLELKASSDTKQKRKSLAESEYDSAGETHLNEPKLKFASKKRNKDFHRIFKKIPKSDRLIDDFSCAFSKDILVQGRMYLSTGYICFKSNILGWVTNLMIPLQEVVQIEKRSTAGLFPNGMIIKTLYQKHTFATFISRDTTFDLLTKVWHRVLLEKDGLLGEEGDTDFEVEDNDDSLDELSDEDEEADVTGIEYEADTDDAKITDEDGEVEDRGLEDDQNEDSDTRNGVDAEYTVDKSIEQDGVQGNKNTLLSDGNSFKGFPLIGPLTHPPTSSGYEKESKDTFIVEDTFAAPLGVIFNLLFGKDTSYYIKVLKNQKNVDIEESNITGLAKEGDTRDYKYVKPLGGSIGPKKTSCIINDKVLSFDLTKCIVVEQTTSTPDVPSGNSFKIRTKIFLYWGENNSTKIHVITTIEWTGSSWIKGPIEKGSIEGQKESMKVLISSINEIIKNGAGDKSKRPRKRSIMRSPKEAEKFDSPPPPPQETTIIEKLNNLIGAIGELVPIPMLPSLAVGYIISFLGLLVIIHIHNWMFSSQSFKLLSNNTLQLDNQKFFLIPSIDNTLENRETILKNQVTLWEWINEKSNSKLKVNLSDDYTKDYNHQELKDISRLTQMKLNELNKLLNE